MLVVRDPQLAALREERLQKMEDRLMEHASQYFPEVCAQLRETLREAVKASMAQASRYGFEGEREVCKYLNLQLRFGRDFDRDPECWWAHPLLNSSLPGPPKMERLYLRALAHEDKARGYFTIVGGRLNG